MFLYIFTFHLIRIFFGCIYYLDIYAFSYSCLKSSFVIVHSQCSSFANFSYQFYYYFYFFPGNGSQAGIVSKKLNSSCLKTLLEPKHLYM